MSTPTTNSTPEQQAHRALGRLLANGPLTGLPSRPQDQELLASLAATRFEPGRTLREVEVNEALKAWLATFCAPFGIDHVTLRRMLVDARLLVRTRSGSTYEVNPDKSGDVLALGSVDPAKILAEVRDERERRKQQRVPGGNS